MGKLEQMSTTPKALSSIRQRERKTSEIGELIMNRLKNIDKVAYSGARQFTSTSRSARVHGRVEGVARHKESGATKAKSGEPSY